MKLTQLMETIIDSDPHEWTIFSDPPLYSGASHGSVAIFASDVDLTLAWGEDPFPNPAYDFQADSHLFESLSRIQVDVFWRGSFVNRELVLRVDRSDAYMPIPATSETGEDFFVQNEIPFARFFHGINNRMAESMPFDHYLEAAKLDIRSRGD